jgi:hypothetical protein
MANSTASYYLLWLHMLPAIGAARLATMSRKKQAQDEREIFDLFIECAKLDIPESSIRSGSNREPDILCTLDGSPCAFELCELSNQEEREAYQLVTATDSMLRGSWPELPHEISIATAQLYSAHHVSIAFNEKANLRVRRTSVVALLNWLAQHTPPADRQMTNALPDTVRRAVWSITFIPIASPQLLHVDDYWKRTLLPDLRVLDKKLEATYKAECPVELLLHAERSMASREVWLFQYEQQVRDKIDGSQFRRVWVFNPAERLQPVYGIWLIHENTSWR